ncbi:MAG: trypsin-like peptidase domain-containing protein [Actinomycetota bacterium]
MNQDNTPTSGQGTSPEGTPAESVGAETIVPAASSGHDMPATFASAAPSAQNPHAEQAGPAHAGGQAPSSTVPPIPFGAPGQGSAFGIPQGTTQPLRPHDEHTTEPFGPEASPSNAKDRKGFGPTKVAALIVAAALVGGAAGLGGSYLGATLWPQPISSNSSGPGAVTVNNPGSVNETAAIATKVLPSVVTIDVAGASEGGSGSGVVLSDDGYVLTNTHVVTLGGAAADAAIRVTTSDGKIYDATMVGTDPIYDLAVIKIEDAEGLTPIDFADSSALNVGSTAVAVGAPLGLSNSVTTGIVSALNRSIEIASSAVPDTADQDPQEDGEQPDGEGGPFQFDIPGMGQQSATETISIAVIQTDAAINPGNSGGALVDSEGNLIGINVAIATAGNSEESGSIGVGFAIPSNVAERIADEIIENGEATHGLLGASVRDASSVEGSDVAGAFIVEAVDGGAAEDAGLRADDVVTNFNGVPITGASDLTAQVRAAAAGSTATITYERDGSSYEVEVTLGALEL